MSPRCCDQRFRCADYTPRYENEDVALNTGQILKEKLRHESIARILLYSEE